MVPPRGPPGRPAAPRRLWIPRLSRRSYGVFLVLYTVLFALGLGLGTAQWVVQGDYPIGRVQARAWTAWPTLGSREVDPYARAILTRTGDIPLALGEGMPLAAEADDAGRRLDARCRYRIEGLTPAARVWTLTLYDEAGRPVQTDLERSGFTSAEILREESGRFAVVLSRTPSPGNWLQMPAEGRVRVVLRLYDTPVAGVQNLADQDNLPAISQLGCGP